MAKQASPIDTVFLVKPYPDARPTKDALPLSAISAGRPTVLHLFTGWGGCWPCASQMDRWADIYGARAAFICVGCAGPALANQFTKELQLSKCTVSYVGNGRGPKWGQLGCNGFIVLDAELRVVCDATSAFLEIRELAFAHVEALVNALVAGAAIPRVCPGQQIVLQGLKKAELNGLPGLCVGPVAEDGRCGVALADGRRLSVKVENIVGGQVDGECGGGGGECGDCADESCGGGGEPAEAVEEFQDDSWQKGGQCQPRKKRAADDAPEAAPEHSHDHHVRTTVAPLAPTASVLVKDLDDEHAQCEAALEALLEHRDGAALRGVLEAFEEHFAHEEQMLDAHVYADVADASGFSALAGQRKSHFGDHTRQLQMLRAELARNGGSAAIVPAPFIDEVMRTFERHAADYDATYAEPLAAALAAAA